MQPVFLEKGDPGIRLLLLYVHLVFELNPTHLWKYPGLTMMHRCFHWPLCSFVFMDSAGIAFWWGFIDPLNHYRKSINLQAIMVSFLVHITHSYNTLTRRFWRSHDLKNIWFFRHQGTFTSKFYKGGCRQAGNQECFDLKLDKNR